MADLVPSFEIGDTVWRAYGPIAFKDTFDEWNPDSIEPWTVDRITAKRVFICSYIDPENPPYKMCVLNRRRLQYSGWVYCYTVNNGAGVSPGALFLVRRPEAYRRQTVGYLIGAQARELLGVSADASTADIRAAYLKLVKAHHPDKPGGDNEKFTAVQLAFERLSKTPSLADIFAFVRETHSDAEC